MKVAIAVNAMLALGSLYLLLLQPNSTDLDVRMRYVELDREGVINEAQLAKFHPSYGFGTFPRNSVPRYIAGPALMAERRNAQLAFAASTVSLITLAFTKRKIRMQFANHLRGSKEPESHIGVSK